MNQAIDLAVIGATPIAFGLILARVSMFVVAAPMFGKGTVPNLVKLGLCMALSLFWYPNYIGWASELQTSQAALVIALFTELIAGFCVGYMVRLILLPARIAGTYIGQELGFSLGQVADPTSGTASNETGLLFDALGLVVFWLTDVHHQSFRMLGYSTQALQIDREFIFGLASETVSLISRSHELALLMVAPLASVLFLILVAMSVMMRAWPQVTLFSFGSGARLLTGLTALAFFIPTIILNMASVFESVALAVTEMLFGIR